MALIPVDTTKILMAMRDDLQAWATTYGGRISLATDAFNVLELLAESPANWRGVLLWRGKVNSGDDRVKYGICEHTVSIIISAQKALSPTAEDVFVNGTRIAVLTLAELMVERIAQWQFDPTVVHRSSVYHRATSLYEPPADVNLHAYDVSFTFHSLQRIDCNPVPVEVSIV